MLLADDYIIIVYSSQNSGPEQHLFYFSCSSLVTKNWSISVSLNREEAL